MCSFLLMSINFVIFIELSGWVGLELLLYSKDSLIRTWVTWWSDLKLHYNHIGLSGGIRTRAFKKICVRWIQFKFIANKICKDNPVVPEVKIPPKFWNRIRIFLSKIEMVSLIPLVLFDMPWHYLSVSPLLKHKCDT